MTNQMRKALTHFLVYQLEHTSTNGFPTGNKTKRPTTQNIADTMKQIHNITINNHDELQTAINLFYDHENQITFTEDNTKQPNTKTLTLNFNEATFNFNLTHKAAKLINL